MPFASTTSTSAAQVRNVRANTSADRASADAAGDFDLVLSNAVATASTDDKKIAAPALQAKSDEERKQEAKAEERQNLPPELAGLAANIAASPNQLAWQGSVSAADAQASAAEIASGSVATTGVASIDAALSAIEAAGVMSLQSEAGSTKPAHADGGAILSAPQGVPAGDLNSLQNMLMAARQMLAPANVTAPAAATADTFTLDAALPAVRVQLLETADDGASHTVLKAAPTDGSALGIDLKLDGQGNATLVLNVANDAEHMRLQQTLSALHAGFEAMGLALNVELRQGSGDDQPAPAPETSRRIGMVRAVADTGTPAISRMRNSEPASTGSQIHFYA